MKQKIIRGHRLLLDADHDRINDVIWYYDIFRNVNSISLYDINVMVYSTKNDISVEIYPLAIRDILTNGYMLPCWFMSYSRELLDVFTHHKLYHLPDLNIQIDEYPNRIEMSFDNTDDAKTLFGFVKHMPFIDPRIKVNMGDDIFTVSLPYDVKHVTEILHNVLYVAKFKTAEYDRKCEYACCPHCYTVNAIVESNSNFNVAELITNNGTCLGCGEKLSKETSEYILIDELMQPCISMMGKYKPDIITYACCQSHPEASDPVDRAYIYGSMTSEIYNFVEAEILNHNETETDMLPISITKDEYSDFDHMIGRSLSSDFVKFDISIRNIRSNPERAFMLGILVALITKALVEYEESKK